MNEPNPIVWRHLESAAEVADAGLTSLREQLGEETAAAVGRAIKAGSTMQVVAALALDGRKSLELNLVSPAGKVVNLGRVEFSAAALN